MVRFSTFPLVFGGCLIAFAWGFYNRRKLFPEVEVIKRQKAIDSHQQAREFKEKVAEGIKREREKKQAKLQEQRGT